MAIGRPWVSEMTGEFGSYARRKCWTQSILIKKSTQGRLEIAIPGSSSKQSYWGKKSMFMDIHSCLSAFLSDGSSQSKV